MNKFMKRSVALLLVFVVVVSLISTIGFSASAAEISYVYDGKYIYNWGTRGEVATFLSPNAESFYEDNNTSYDVLSSYSGGTGKSDATSSELYRELKELMSGAHSYITSYSATKELYKYTDCQGGGGKISSFYSGKQIGPSWDGGSSWNREHTWPNSKGLGGSDENDIMMLRPTSVSENSSRGNTAYGKSSGYYNPNRESGGDYDLRGDVARIFLYVYVRWGNNSYAWGTSGVMESVEVLLEWMEADPVDTWELGRNDSVESITGTRNVFVDYPELAFILFGEEIPEDMITPSGADEDDCGHNNLDYGVVVAATCTDKGYTLYTCRTSGCNFSYKENYTDPKGHSYTEIVTAPTCTKIGFTTYTCSECNNSYIGNTVPTVAHSYEGDTCKVCGLNKASTTEATISFEDVGNRTEFNTSLQVWEQNGIKVTNNKSKSTNNVADYYNPVRFYAHSSVTVEAPANITKIIFDCNSSSYANALKNSIGSSALISSDKVTVELDGTSNTFTVEELTAQVRMDAITVVFGETVQACQHTNTTIDNEVVPTCTASGLTEGKHCSDCGEIIVEQQTVPALGHDWIDATYENPKTCDRCGLTDGEKLPSEEVCEHNYVPVVTAPTCTEAGFTTYTCTMCADSYVGDAVEARGHNYVSNVCSICGDTKVTDTEANISFTDVGNRTEFNTSLQVWEQNGIKVTNNKSKSTNDVADYYDPARFYANSDVTISYPGMTKIEINCKGLTSKYVSGWLNVTAGATATNDGGIITIVFDTPVDSFTYTKLSAQCRAYDITVYCESITEEPCQHTNIAVKEAVDPTCTDSGLTAGKHCSDCGEIIVEQQTVPALGHDWIDATYENPKTCKRCGLTEGEKLPSEEVCEHSYTSVVTAPTCTEAGFTTYTCTLCADTYIADTAAALGHDWIDATYENPKTCDRCGLTEGEKLPSEEVCEHSYTSVVTAPTCTEAGFTTYTCTLCADTYIADTVAALGHDWIDATYENPKSCDRCGLTEGEKLPSEEVCEHSYTSVVTAPTCTEAGFTTYTCPLCADTYIADTVAALGHDWIDATYENPKTCDRCGLTEGEKLPEVDSGENEMPDENETPEENDKDHTKCEAESILQRILTAIINFFRKLFGLPEKCVCGDEL